MDLNNLKLQAERLSALQEIRNLMGKYSYLHTAFRNVEYVKLWAKRDDSLLIMPFGKFQGFEAIRHCYVDMHGDRNDVEVRNQLKGFMMVHLMNTEVIEVAEDGKSAKGSWISPGIEVAPQTGKEGGAWCWGKYEVDFIKEEEWKFWHMTLYPVFLTPYSKSWGRNLDNKMDGQMLLEDPLCQPPDSPMWEYGPNSVYPENQPRIPESYKTFQHS
nr:nuclear transport factor 2 family protein [uncultured Lachnoanaerobaculum sp.]